MAAEPVIALLEQRERLTDFVREAPPGSLGEAGRNLPSVPQPPVFLDPIPFPEAARPHAPPEPDASGAARLRIFLAVPGDLEEEENGFARGLALVAPERRARTLRLRRREDALARLAAGLLLRRGLGVTRDADLRRGPHGKPFPADGKTQCGLSYGRGLVVLSVGSFLHGLDLEPVVPTRPEVVRRCLTPEEYALYRRADDPDLLFCRLWTGKESLLKAVGCGLRRAPGGFSLLLSEGAATAPGGERRFLRQWRIAGHCLSLTAGKPGIEPEWLPVRGPELLAPDAAARD